MVVADVDSPNPTDLSLIHRASSPTPMRPRALSSGPVSSRHSSMSFGSGAVSPAGGNESPVRGRTMDILGAHHGLISRATARRRAGPSSIDLDSSLIQARLTQPITRPTSITPDATIFEPLPPSTELLVPNVHDVLTRASTSLSASSIDVSKFGGHRDTFALLDLRGLPRQAPELPFAVAQRLASLLDVETYTSLRLTCRCWSVALDAVPPVAPRYSAAQRLPMELLQQIYANMEPTDFNAARRTCRAWMMAGLDTTLLEGMLRKGGWWEAVIADREFWGENGLGRDGINDEWMMSKRLATECSLTTGWTGIGFDDAASKGETIEDKNRGTGKSSLILTCQTDFSELAGGYSADNERSPMLHFTPSACGRFVMIAEGCIIYIYQLKEVGNWPSRKLIGGGGIKQYTTVICPKRVLAVSMDTSSRRFAVAALLDDRTGMVCDINLSSVDQKDQPSQSEYFAQDGSTQHDTYPSSNLDKPDIQSPMPATFDHSIFTHRFSHAASHVSAPSAEILTCPIPLTQHSYASSHPTSLPARSIYRSLCSRSDPPLSVAICPQRRCVAFGSSSGIELHWVDALTGQDLNRWFPLTAPSDFLYFVPPRRGVDSAKKLRLISSAAYEGQKGTLKARFRSQIAYGSGWNEMARWRECPNGDHGAPEDKGIEHYKAIPLSDGEMVLFTDPVSKVLCLSVDTPMGVPTRLERKFVFQGPGRQVPTVYAAGGEMRWGLRVVAVYEDGLWLFCISPDIVYGIKNEKARINASSANAEPSVVQGVCFAKVDGVSDLAIDSSYGGLTVWVFATDGMAYTFQMKDGLDGKRFRKSVVGRDGAVVDVEDEDGDVIIRDTSRIVENVYCDGTSSLLLLYAAHLPERIVHAATDTQESFEDEGYCQWSGEEDEYEPGPRTFAIHVPPLDGRWSVEEADRESDADCFGPWDWNNGDAAEERKHSGNVEAGVGGTLRRTVVYYYY